MISASPSTSRTQRPSGSSDASVMTPRVPSALRSVAATDLGAPFDQHDAEAAVAGQAVAHELPVSGLEDVQRHGRPREQHRRQGEHRKARPGHAPPWHDRTPIRTKDCARAMRTTDRRRRLRDARRTGHSGRPSLVFVLLVVLLSFLYAVRGSGLRRSGCGGRLVGRPAHAPARSRPHSYAGPHAKRTTRKAPPKPTSVTQPQPGGSASSVEPVDCIGSSFPTRGNQVLLLPLAAVSIHLGGCRVNPTRTGHSRRPRWRRAPSHELHVAVI